MTGPLFRDLQRDIDAEQRRLLARIRQLEDQLATCQAERDRAREAGERLAGAVKVLVNDSVDSLNRDYEYIVDITTLKDLQAALAAARQEAAEE